MDDGGREGGRQDPALCWVMIEGHCRGDGFDPQSGLTAPG